MLRGAAKGIGAIASTAGKIIPGPSGLVLKGVGRVATGISRGPVSSGALRRGAVGPSLGGGSGSFGTRQPDFGRAAPRQQSFGPRAQSGGTAAAAGVAIGGQCTTPGGLRGRWVQDKNGEVRCKATRRMNPTNPKALRRGQRREERFVAIARRALKGSKYKIATAGSRSRRDLQPGHTHVR